MDNISDRFSTKIFATRCHQPWRRQQIIRINPRRLLWFKVLKRLLLEWIGNNSWSLKLQHVAMGELTANRSQMFSAFTCFPRVHVVKNQEVASHWNVKITFVTFTLTIDSRPAADQFFWLWPVSEPVMEVVVCMICVFHLSMKMYRYVSSLLCFSVEIVYARGIISCMFEYLFKGSSNEMCTYLQNEEKTWNANILEKISPDSFACSLTKPTCAAFSCQVQNCDSCTDKCTALLENSINILYHLKINLM